MILTLLNIVGDKMFENSKWIKIVYEAYDSDSQFPNEEKSILFRRNFHLKNSIEKVILSICALGFGECFVNGERITDNLLTTPYTQYDKKVIYQTYDITDFVRPGENAIGVHVGNGYYNDNLPTWKDNVASWKHTPKLIAEIRAEYIDMSEDVIVTDESWKSNFGPCVFNHVRQGEIYDASFRNDGYSLCDFDDTSWKNSSITFSPGGELSGEDTVPVRVVETISPVGYKDGVYDFGVNISGRIKVKMRGEKGRKVTFGYYEIVDDDNIDSSNNMYLVKYNMPVLNKNIVICSGEEDEYAPVFCYHGFRYVRVDNAPADMEIVAEFICSDLEMIGSFECSDKMLEKIHSASVRSTRSNFVGFPTDCPHREQNGWTGDALCSLDQSLMNFEMTTAYKKWLGDFKVAQRPSGQLPGIVPTAGFGYNWGSGPAWDSCIILIPYKHYLHTKSTELIEYMWDAMEKYMGYIQSMSDNYLVNFGLGDWCPVRPEHMCPTIITDTAFFYADSVAMEKMAKLTGRDYSCWGELAKNIRNEWNSKFAKDDTYHSYQTFFACGIYNGLFDDDKKEEYASKLAKLVEDNDYHIDCGILGTKWIFSALSEHGYEEVLYKMVTNPSFPSYANWIINGMTTLCERWDMSFSQNHHMFSEVDNWFYRYLGGIKFTDDGLVISPVYLKDVEYVKVTHRGITVERKGKDVKVKLSQCAQIKIGTHNEKVCPGEYLFKL
ncbi:MAG: hypothetical protein E7394_00760 [Ruminococcaceae bacterium]|nr:hypothetical protein [Oscillospiraceae bacterium]